MSRSAWDDLIQQMTVFGLAIDDAEKAAVGSYLAEVFGPDSPRLVDVNAAGPADFKKFPTLDEGAVGKLLAERERRNGFASIADVETLLGSETFAKLRGYLTVLARETRKP
jgi:DNA uptake protein ComE-like DNA-binding protein